MDIFLRLRGVWIFAIGIVLLTLGCATLKDQEARYGSNPPVITATFAKDKIVSGDTWKIYINASDADGDMSRFVCSVFQDGGYPYPFDLIEIKPEQKKKLSGYLYLPTYTSHEDLWNVHLELYLHIVDKAGHRSKEEVFELRFASKASNEEADKTLFDDKPLGPIMINITNQGGRGLPDIPDPKP